MNQKGCPTYFFPPFLYMRSSRLHDTPPDKSYGPDAPPSPATGYGFTGFHTRHRLWQKVPIVELHEFIPLPSIRGTETEIYVVHPSDHLVQVGGQFRNPAHRTRLPWPPFILAIDTHLYEPSFSRCRTLAVRSAPPRRNPRLSSHNLPCRANPNRHPAFILRVRTPTNYHLDSCRA